MWIESASCEPVGGLTDQFELTILELDTDALLHEVNRHQQPCLLFPPYDGPLVSHEGTASNADVLARFQTTFHGKRYPQIDQIADLLQIGDKPLDIVDCRCFLHAAGADRLITRFVITAKEYIIIEERGVSRADTSGR